MRQLPTNTIFCFLTLCAVSSCQLWVPMVRNPEEAKDYHVYMLDFIGRVAALGRTAESHNVTTEDGYILDLYRIPPNPSLYNKSYSGPPFYLQHGMHASAEQFILLGGEESLPHALSDAGYDVWIGNLRGSYHGQRHRSWSTDESRFWDFSLDEWALKDTPAILNYILKATGRSELTYVGLSLGGLLHAMLLSHRADFNDKINLSVLFSPVVFWNITEPTATNAAFNLLAHLFQPLSTDGAFPSAQPSWFSYVLAKYFCGINLILWQMCLTVLDLITGTNHENLNIDLDDFLNIYLYTPAGVSFKTQLHFLQHMRTGKFQFYDYNDDNINLQHYGQKQPPEYNLSNIVSPMLVYHGTKDQLATAQTIKFYFNKISSKASVIYKEVEDYTHIDFIVAKDVKKIVYDKLLDILPKLVKFS